MKVTFIVLYHITDPANIPDIEKAIKESDEEAFARLGPYFKEHQGTVYLLNPADIGIGGDAWEYIQVRYDLQGGIEVTGTEEELLALECLLQSKDCFACRIGDRFLILPKEEASVAFVEDLKRWSIGPVG